MIRSLRSIRDLSATSSVWIPGRNGPAEPFNVSCIGNDSETWNAIRRWVVSRYRWDVGTAATDTGADEAWALFSYRLATITPETWQRLKVGYGDRIRALWAVRRWCARSEWKERMTGSQRGLRAVTRTRAERAYIIAHREARRGERFTPAEREKADAALAYGNGVGRPYTPSMSIREPNPVAVAVAVETAAAGIRGPVVAGRGRPKIETVTTTPADAREALIGTPTREAITGHRCIGGGIVNRTGDGKIGRVVTRSRAYTFYDDDGSRWTGEETREEWKMIPSQTRTEYPPCVVAEVTDIGTERNRYVPQPIPQPQPTNRITHHAPAEWTPDLDHYRAQLAEYYAGR